MRKDRPCILKTEDITMQFGGVVAVNNFSMEEYIEYLEEHPHIALFEDGVLKYEVYRQYVGEEQTFDVQLTRNAPKHSSSLDNMGAVITVFEY